MRSEGQSSIEVWLKRWLPREAWQNFFEGTVFILVGLLVQAIVSYCTAFVTLMVLFRVMAVLSLLNRETDLVKPWIIVGSVVLFLVLSAGGALRHRQALDYSQTKVGFTSSVAPTEVLKALVMLICEILFAGPRLIIVGSEDLARAWSQWRADRVRLASMLNWLLTRENKVSLAELSIAFGEDASLLRQVPGVIWLAKDEGVVILAEELRKELRSALKEQAAGVC